MTAPLSVAHGTAEQLARLHHFRALDLPEAHELDPVLRFLVGRVENASEVIEHLGDELERLYALVTEDWSESDLDEIPEADWTRYSFGSREQETAHQWGITIQRLTDDIEGRIHLARLIHAETSGHRGVAA